eukprot:TRINITY_DN15376_c0_g1_i1.p1 TRINITY_DN15376_c0_g1~~TRINITY_DN15376_c0_g1_i1.p1  ORF type:complete len:180 (+),score=49.91 TRINITY_DN15376_c0_g1_i1:95-634(+)
MEAGKLCGRIFASAAKTRNKVVTLTFLRRDGKILLGMKKRGLGQGKWNGFGGKVEAGETVTQAAARELLEECGMVVKEESLLENAVILQQLQDFKELLEIHVFQTSEFTGEPKETEEMRPQWFQESQIPFDEMWVDDKLWYPLMLKKERFRAYYTFPDHSNIGEQDIQVLASGDNFFKE